MNAVPQQAVHIQRRSSVPATVVIADDDAEQLSLLCSILDETGLDARGFNAATEALDSVNGSGRPALFITRLCMSKIDGWQFCRLVRSPEYPDLNRVPILVLCDSLAGREPQRVATALGAHAFFANPFDTDAFIRRVLSILRSQLSVQPLRALIVGADKHQVSLLNDAFTAVGYMTDTARTLTAASDAFARSDYDVAVIDHELPDGPADSLLEQLQDTRPECVSIMVSADQSSVSSVDWMNRGAAACVQKPCDPTCLVKLCDQTHKERSLVQIEMLQKKRARELRENQNRFRALSMVLEEAVIIIDMGGTVSFWNAAAVRMFGYTPEDALGMFIDDLIAPQRNYSEYQKVFLLLTGTGGDHDPDRSFELPARCKDGHEINVALSLSTVELSFDCHAVVIARDVTAGKRTKEALDEIQQTVSSIVHSIDIAVMSYSIKENRYLYVSPSAEKIYGRKFEKFAYKKFTPVDFIHADDAAVLHSIKTQLAASGTAEEECRIVKPDGTAVWIHARLKIVRDACGRPCRVDKVITDITDRRNRDIRIRQQYEQLSGILDSVDDIIITLAAGGGHAIYVSPSFERFFGTEACRHLHNTGRLSEFVCPDDKNILIDHIDQLHRNGCAEHVVRAGNHNGDSVWFRLCSKIIHDEKGEHAANQHILHDITKHKREEQDRENVRDQLAHRQALESVGRLAGGLAHGFNNMLGVIIGHADLALCELTPGHKLHTALSTIRRTAEAPAAIIRKLLAFAGKQVAAPRALDLNATIESLLVMLRRFAGNTINLVWQPGKNLGQVYIDPVHIEQVLTELCVNTRNAIEDRGNIHITTGAVCIREPACEKHPGVAPGDYVTLTVNDNGKGMDGETLARVFVPFFAGNGRDTMAGLGLPAVYGIIQQNKGFINIASEQGIGTCVTMYLPSYTEKARQEAEHDHPGPVDRDTGATILLFEDKPDNMELYCAMLETFGCTVLCAATYEDCLRLAKTHTGRIDILMTETVMAGISGREVADAVLAIRPEIQCLFMSGYPGAVIAGRGIPGPGLNVIEKPFSLQGITVKVKELLGSCEGHESQERCAQFVQDGHRFLKRTFL